MIYLFYTLIGLALILLQSLALSSFLPPWLIYDLLIPMVVYLALFYANGKSLALILFLGLIMDSITGGAMGIYMLAYFWIFVGIQLAVRFFQKDSTVLMVSAIILGVLLENGLFVIVAGLSPNEFMAEADITGGIVGRLMVAGITGPVLLSVLKTFYTGVETNPNLS